MHIKLNANATWPGVVTEVLQVVMRGGSREYLIEKQGHTSSTAGAQVFTFETDKCKLEYQSPRYVQSKHESLGYWWVSDNHFSLVPVTNQGATHLLKSTFEEG